jgi:hypothetical protein
MRIKNPRPPRVVLRLPHTARAVLALGKVIYEHLATNTVLFPSPNPPLVTFSADIAALDAAETFAATRAAGAVESRDGKLVIVLADLKRVRAYVQELVSNDPVNAATFASEAGLSLAKAPFRMQNELTVKPRKNASGSVDARARATVKAAHEWQTSIDGGTTWTSAPTTLQASTTLSGFTPGITLMVRHRAITKDGADNWGNPVSLVVV